jgi:hypothetical protein
VSGEWVHTKGGFFGGYRSGYFVGGYRFGTWTPYVGHARSHKTEPGTIPISFIEQDSSTLGLRWDFAKQWDLKAQLDHIIRHDSNNAFFNNQQPGFAPAGKLNVFSATVNFVF